MSAVHQGLLANVDHRVGVEPIERDRLIEAPSTSETQLGLIDRNMLKSTSSK